jgi:hypothetical protein
MLTIVDGELLCINQERPRIVPAPGRLFAFFQASDFDNEDRQPECVEKLRTATIAHEPLCKLRHDPPRPRLN